MKHIVFASLYLLWCQAVIAAPRHPGPYALKTHIKTQTDGSAHTDLRFINQATGQTLWRKHVGVVDRVEGSPDRQALALFAFVGGKTPFRLLIWQAGKPLRVLDDSSVPKGEEGFIDGVINIVWSPNDRRVLYRVYQSGGKEMNNGLLYCLDTKSWHLVFIPGNVRQMEWHGVNEVRYRVVQYHVTDAEGTERASFQWKKRDFET